MAEQIGIFISKGLDDDVESGIRAHFESRESRDLQALGQQMQQKAQGAGGGEAGEAAGPSNAPGGKPAASAGGGGASPSGAPYPQKSGLDQAVGSVVGPLAEGAAEGMMETYRFARWLSGHRLPDLFGQDQSLSTLITGKRNKYSDKARAFGVDPEKGGKLGGEYNIAQELVKGVGQFMLPDMGIGKGMKALNVGTKVVNGVKSLSKWGHAISGALTGGIAFDPRQPKLVNDMAIPAILRATSASPEIKKAAEDLLATNPNDPELLARLKSVLDGELMGLGIKGLLAVPNIVRGYRAAGATLPPGPKKVTITPEGIEVTTPEMAAAAPPKFVNPDVRRIADDYRRDAGLPQVKPETLRSIDHEAAKKIADNYDAMKHAPDDPRVASSYRSFIEETWEMFEQLEREGYVFEPWTKEGQPYKNSIEMRTDVLQNKHLYFFTGGDLPAGHPLLKTMPNGLTANDVFRAVHDIYGHAMEGHQFGPIGETNAWASHGSMYSTNALPAMSSETIGQNSWVNFGAHLRDDAGAIAGKGEFGHVPPEARPYAEQKAGILPPEGMLDTAYKAQTEFGGRLEQGLGQGPERSMPFARDAFQAYQTGGGFTVHPQKGLQNPTQGYGVSIYPERGKVIPKGEEVTPKHLDDFYAANKDVLDANPELNMGAWRDEASGSTSLDLSQVYQNQGAAQEAGRMGRQKAIYDFATGKSIDVDYSGYWQKDLTTQAAEAQARLKDFFGGTRLSMGVDPSILKDASIVAASLIARGAAKGGNQVRQALKADFGAAIEPIYDKVIARAENVVNRLLRAGFDHAQATKSALKYFREGQEGIGWYSKTLPELEAIYGPEDARMLVGFLAATSPNTTIEGNVTLALKALEQWKSKGKLDANAMMDALSNTANHESAMEGGMFKGYLKSVVDNLERVAKGEPMSGLKVQNFHQALLGDPNAVVIDRWMMRALWPNPERGVNPRTGEPVFKLTEAQYAHLANWVREEAKRRGVTPVDLQAAIWVGVKKHLGREGDTAAAFEEVIKKRQEEIKKASKRPVQREMSFDDFSKMIDEEAAAAGDMSAPGADIDEATIRSLFEGAGLKYKGSTDESSMGLGKLHWWDDAKGSTGVARHDQLSPEGLRKMIEDQRASEGAQ